MSYYPTHATLPVEKLIVIPAAPVHDWFWGTIDEIYCNRCGQRRTEQSLKTTCKRFER